MCYTRPVSRALHAVSDAKSAFSLIFNFLSFFLKVSGKISRRRSEQRALIMSQSPSCVCYDKVLHTVFPTGGGEKRLIPK